MDPSITISDTYANDLDRDLDSERMQKLADYGFSYMGRVVLGHDNNSISEANGDTHNDRYKEHDQSDK